MTITQTPSTKFPPELETGARAMGAERTKYRRFVWDNETEEVWVVCSDSNDLHHFRGSEAECQAWVDCQAFAAGLAAIPVSDGLVGNWLPEVEERDHPPAPIRRKVIETAIRYLTGRAE